MARHDFGVCIGMGDHKVGTGYHPVNTAAHRHINSRVGTDFYDIASGNHVRGRPENNSITIGMGILKIDQLGFLPVDADFGGLAGISLHRHRVFGRRYAQLPIRAGED